ncbi:MAG: DUF169 domain-containing protein [Deltaproteobacteria bacterium]|nr:DUF169 domain-containing protein [Deltaproteobacteria bacterium]
MAPTTEQVERIRGKLRLDTPLIAVYDAAPGPDFEPLVRATARACCFAYWPRWVKGETLAIERGDDSFTQPTHGCPGAQRAFGLARGGYPPYMAHFLTDGVGAPSGEGLKATPELAQAYLERSRPPVLRGDSVLLGPLRAERWDAVRSVTFFADPDRLSALMTLAAFWSSEPDEIVATFSSGCGLMLRELEQQPRDRAVLGATDIAMRKYIPRELLALSVSPARFEKMLGVPDGVFLDKEWWGDLLAGIPAGARGGGPR